VKATRPATAEEAAALYVAVPALPNFHHGGFPAVPPPTTQIAEAEMEQPHGHQRPGPDPATHGRRRML
jgi:hypothetical protein